MVESTLFPKNLTKAVELGRNRGEIWNLRRSKHGGKRNAMTDSVVKTCTLPVQPVKLWVVASCVTDSSDKEKINE